MVQEKSVVLVDDHTLFREGLKSIIERDPRFKLVGEAGTFREAVRVAGKIRPDLIIVDISLPDRSGFDLTRELLNRLPNSRVMVVSMHSKLDYIAEAFRAGATGYVVKDSASENLLRGLESISKGQYFMDTAISPCIVKELIEFPTRKEKITDAAYKSLTKREQEVMGLLAEGLPNREVAEHLHVSPKTIENHRANIMSKLGLHSTFELIRYAAKLGLIDVDLWKN